MANPPEGVPQVTPRLAYVDVGSAVEWLTRAFGFEEHLPSRIEAGAKGILMTDMLLGLGGRIMIGGDGPHGLSSPAKLGGRSLLPIVYVDDIDAHYERARAAGAEIVLPIEDAPWGDRRYEALDPEGHRWYFAERVREVPREVWMKQLG